MNSLPILPAKVAGLAIGAANLATFANLPVPLANSVSILDILVVAVSTVGFADNFLLRSFNLSVTVEAIFLVVFLMVLRVPIVPPVAACNKLPLIAAVSS